LSEPFLANVKNNKKGNKKYMKLPYIIAIVVIVAAAGLGLYLSKADKKSVYDASMPAKEMASNKESSDGLKEVDQLPAIGDEDQIIDDVIKSFDDEAKIESEGDADVAVVSEGDSEINSLTKEYNENSF